MCPESEMPDIRDAEEFRSWFRENGTAIEKLEEVNKEAPVNENGSRMSSEG